MVSLAPLAGTGLILPTASVDSDLAAEDQWPAPPALLGARAQGDNVSVYVEDPGPGGTDITRNQTKQFTVNLTNEGSQNDTFDLAVTHDSNWRANLERYNASLEAGKTALIKLTIHSPRDAGDDVQFNISAVSQNNSEDYDYVLFTINLDMSHAVELAPKGDNETSPNRGQTATYRFDLMNIGEEMDSYRLSYSPLPKDWTAEMDSGEGDKTKVTNVGPNGEDLRQVILKVSVPNNAEVNETATVRLIATSMAEGFSHIDAYGWSLTTAADGRTYGLRLEIPAGNETTIIPEATATYTLRVYNDGDEPDTFKLSHTNVSEGWNVWLSDDTVTVPADDYQEVTLEVTAPEEAQEGDTQAVRVSAYSTNRPQYEDQIDTATRVRIPVRGLELTVDPTAITTPAGTPAQYTVYLTNTGTDPDSFDLTLEHSGNMGWTFNFNSGRVVNLGVNETRELTLKVTPRSEAVGGQRGWANVTATSVGDENASASVATVTTVLAKPELELVVYPLSRWLFPGDQVTFNLTITNKGNIPDNYTLEVSDDPSGFTSELDRSRLERVLVGGQAKVLLTVSVAEGVQPILAGYYITVTSDEDGSLVEQQAITLEVVPFAALELKLQAASGAVNPGATHQYNFTVQNLGNKQDNLTVSVSGLPGQWQATLYKGGSLLTGELILDQDELANLRLKVTTDSEDLAGSHSFTLMVSSGVSPLVNETRRLTLQVNEFHAFELSPANETVTQVQTNSTVTSQFTVTNNGNAQDTYQFTSPPWPTDWSGQVQPTTAFTLQPGESRVLTITALVPSAAKGGWTELKPKVTSAADPQAPQTYLLRIHITQRAQVTLELLEWEDTIEAGQSRTGAFKVELANKGNGRDNLNLTLTGNQRDWLGYTWQVYDLAAGAKTTQTFDLNVPASVPAGTYKLTLTLTSEVDPTESEEITLSLTVTKPPKTDDDDSTDDDGKGFLPAPTLLAAVGAVGAVAVALTVWRRRHH